MPLTLTRGMRGTAVEDLQGNLRSAGFDIKTDGRFGTDTDRAVRAFQKGRGLKDDGIVGTRTWKALQYSEVAVAAFDPFDPADYAEWLSQRVDQAEATVRKFFGSDAEPRSASPAPSRAAPSPPSRAAATPRPAAPAQPRPPEVSATQNRQHDRIVFPGYAGRGYVIHGFEKFAGWEVQLVGRRIVRRFQGGLRNECAQFVQMFGVPRTSNWRRGPQVGHLAPGTIPVGTVVATLRDGVYHNDYSGRSHVGIYMGHDPYDPAKGDANPGGVWIMDQWNGSPIAKRRKDYSRIANKQGSVARKPWQDAAGRRQTRRVGWASDGEEYFVLMTGI